MHAGLLSSHPVTIDGAQVPAIEATRALLAGSPFSTENPVWGYGLVVEVSGERRGRRVLCTYRSRHPPQDLWGGEAAYFKNVGVPLSIGAQLIAGGEAEGRGVLPPEQALPAGRFFEELARRGITIEETVVEAGTIA